MSQSGALTIAATLMALYAADAIAQQGPQTESQKDAPNALTTLLPHQVGRALCYVGRGAPVTFPLEDIPARRKQRHLTVRRFVFELRSDKHEDSDVTTPPTPGDPYYGFRLIAEVKGRKSPLVAAGDCGSRDLKGFGCGVECDGGVMHFEPMQGNDSLQMRVSDEVNRFRMTWGCGEDEKYEVLLHDPATPTVRMDKADPKVCAPIMRATDRK